MIRDSDRHYETYRLTFPFPLDNDVLCPNAENGAIRPLVVPIIPEYEVEGSSGHMSKLVSHHATIKWYIAKNENVLRSTKQTKKTNELDTQGTNLFGST